MTLVALGIYLLWLILAFGVPITATRRRTGGQDSGIHINGPLQWAGEAAFGVTGLAGLTNPVLDLLGILPRIEPLDHLPLRILGAIIALAGVAATVYAQLSPDALLVVRGGPFRTGGPAVGRSLPKEDGGEHQVQVAPPGPGRAASVRRPGSVHRRLRLPVGGRRALHCAAGRGMAVHPGHGRGAHRWQQGTGRSRRRLPRVHRVVGGPATRLQAAGHARPRVGGRRRRVGFWAALREVFPTTREQRCWCTRQQMCMGIPLPHTCRGRGWCTVRSAGWVVEKRWSTPHGPMRKPLWTVFGFCLCRG